MAEKKSSCNILGLERSDYEGLPSTLCGGCGHDAVTRSLVTAFHEAGTPPHMTAKVSGIGCSSKSTAYFMARSHGFNGLHGRMPSMATGANLANQALQVVGVSGDGDTASIGMGQFVHAARRNVDMIYVVENNGVYGLTKGQFSATADKGAKAKKAGKNPYLGIDLCTMALELGCGFVARTFSANQKQMVEIFKAAIAYRGFCLIDVISPCVTFNPEMEGASKTYKWAKDNQIALNEVGYIPERNAIPELVTRPGEVHEVELHDGSHVHLRTLAEDYDSSDRYRAVNRINEAGARQELLTGLLFLDEGAPDHATVIGLWGDPLYSLPEKNIRPPRKALQKILTDLKR